MLSSIKFFMQNAIANLSYNWIPEAFQSSADALAINAVSKYVKEGLVIGLGSGPMAAAIVRALGNFPEKKSLRCIVTSQQIKLEAIHSGLEVVDENHLPEVDIVFDGADEIDSQFNMIKGGGGALLREKIVHSAAKTIVIAAESPKFVQKFTWPVPVEVHPFAASIVYNELIDKGGRPKLRMLKEGYPYISENSNLILDTHFDLSSVDIAKEEIELRSIPGVQEVGLFSKRAHVYYKAKTDGTFEAIMTGEQV
jgi:ribose 5-phosphate isomerase A